MNSSDLRKLFAAARPLVEQWLDLSEEFAALRDAAKAKGIDWSAVKGLIKAQIQDERDGGDKNVTRILDRAEFASSYAALLGIGGANMNEENISDEQHDPETGELPMSTVRTPVAVTPAPTFNEDELEIPAALRRY